MTAIKELLRRATEDFVTRVYEALRADLLEELRREMGRDAAPAPRHDIAVEVSAAPTFAPEPAPSAAGTSRTVGRIIAHLADHPGATAAELGRELDLKHSSLFRALAVAIADGRVLREREGGTAGYRLAGSPVRRATSTPGAAGTAPPPPPDRFAPGVVQLDQRLLRYIFQNAPTTPRAMVAALGARRETVFKALARIVELGLVSKRGAGRSVVYYPSPDAPDPETGGELSRREAAEAAKRVPTMVTLDDRVAAIAAFVSEHPGCRYAEIEKALRLGEAAIHRAMREARERGLVRMEGERIKTRYFPGNNRTARGSVAPAAPQQLAAGNDDDEDDEGSGADDEDDGPTPSPAVRAAEELAAEIDAALAESMNDVRLAALLQAFVAEARIVQPDLTEGHPAAQALDREVQRIAALRSERNLPYLVGLKREAQADWASIARRARSRVAAIDVEAEQAAPRVRPQRAAASLQRGKSGRDDHDTPFPQLQRRAGRSPLVLVGGIKKNEILEQVRSRYRLDAEWTAAQGANARAIDAFTDRVKNGKIGALVVLEGLFAHSQVNPIVAAAKAAGVPFAYGDRAGTESLRSAFESLEKQLAERSGDDA